MRDLEKLFQRRCAKPKNSLEVMEELTCQLGLPHHHLRFAHTAGTNGKGSVSAMLASILQEAGLSIGLYTSPHLLSYHERFQVNGEKITDEELEEELQKIEELRFIEKAHFFEITTLIAFLWFKKKKVDLVVLETGLGGLYDSTNIVTPEVSIITSIGLDHMDYLGSTLKKITEQKAGIIKPKVPCVTLVQDPEIMDVIVRKAESLQTPLKLIQDTDLVEFLPPLLGEHQKYNMALSVKAARVIMPSISVETIRKGLAKTRWRGRCELFSQGSIYPEVLVDGAHNPHGAQALVDFIRSHFGNRQVTLIFGSLEHKKANEMLALLGPISKHVIFTTIADLRSEKLDNLSRMLPSAFLAPSFEEALLLANRLKEPIVVTGSLYLVAEAIAYLASSS